jgi:uncharacterized membrane protein
MDEEEIKNKKEKQHFLTLVATKKSQDLLEIKKKNKEQIEKKNFEKKEKTEISDVAGTMTLTSAISSLSTLTSETLEFSSMKNKNLLKDFEKLRFKKTK